MSEETETQEVDLRAAFREVSPLLDRLDELLKPLGLEASIVPAKKGKSRMRVTAPSDNGTQPEAPATAQAQAGTRRKQQHHQVAYWKKIKRIMADEDCDVEQARKIYTQRKDAA